MLRECKCCFIHDPDTTLRTFESEEYGDVTIKLCSLSLISSPRAFSLLHIAVEISNGLDSICPSYCDRCDNMTCGACRNCRPCAQCSDYICGECDSIDNCSHCMSFICSECDIQQCSECNKVCCETCLNQSDQFIFICEGCGKYKCFECSRSTLPHNHFHHNKHWFCDDCKVVCVGCNNPGFCPLNWEECGFITCGKCGNDKCWGGCFKFIFCGDCYQPICKKCENQVRFCFKCIKFYCYRKCRSVKACMNCWDNGNYDSTFCTKCCGDDQKECFKCHRDNCLILLC